MQNLFIKYLNHHIYILILLFVANTISVIIAVEKDDALILVEREDYAGMEKEIPLVLKNGKEEEEISLKVNPCGYTKEQCQQKMKEAFDYLQAHIAGENASLSHVYNELNLKLDYQEYPFDLQVIPEDYALIDEEGNVKNETSWLMEQGYSEQAMKKGIKTSIKVILTYGDYTQTQDFFIVIFSKKKSVVEEQFEEVYSQLEKIEKESIYEKSFLLPNKYKEIRIENFDNRQNKAKYFLLCSMIVCGMLFAREEEIKKTKLQERNNQLLRCYPWFVNEIVLMLGAGMQIKNIFTLMISEYEQEKHVKKDERKPLIDELCVARENFQMGMSEREVYYQLGRRLRLPCYIKIMTLLEQNVEHGTKGLFSCFEQEELQALQDRKNLAKKYGEEAGTKLLGPMIILLFVVMCVIMIPAFMSLNG